jgi:threonine dehydratase
VLRTPLRRSQWLSGVSGGEVRLKLETLQPTFSYKVRGAFNAVLRLAARDAGTPPALVTASAGNHGRALAHAAGACGMPLTVYVSAGAPRVKLEAMRAAGAALELCRTYDEAEGRAKQHGAGGRAIFISPYAHPDVIAGAGTVGREIIEDWPEVDTIVAAVGGGGLLAGIAVAAAAAGRPVSVVGVEAEASAPFTASLAAGRIVRIEVQPTLADGLAGNLDPDTPTFDMIRNHVREIVRVTEPELRQAVAGLMRQERLIAEGAGATAVAAVLARRLRTSGQRVAVVLTGANIDEEVLLEILSIEQ